MFNKYFITGLRKLIRDKMFFGLNIAGLAIGMAACMIILSYINYEKSYDRFNNNLNNLHRITYGKISHNGKFIPERADCFYLAGEELSQHIPEIEQYVTLTKTSAEGVYVYKDKSARHTEVFYSTKDFFQVFSYQLTKGNPEHVLDKPNAVVISEKQADFYFGDEDPVGKIIRFKGRFPLEVTGVFKNVPENSHLKFELLVSMEVLHTLTNDFYRKNGWYYVTFFNYLRTKPQINTKALEENIRETHQQLITGRTKVDPKATLGLQKVADIHLKSDLTGEASMNGNQKSLYFLTLIAIFIILIAWINYVNFTTAKSTERGKEVGIRKVVGSTRRQLTFQFLTESILLNGIAFFTAATIVQLTTPYFSNLTGNPIGTNFTTSTWLVIAGITLLGSMLSGFYPAWILTSFKPADVLKGRFYSTRKGALLQKTLITLQLVATIILVAGSLTIFNQLKFMRNHELGFDKENKLVIEGPGAFDSNTETNIGAFRRELENLHFTKNVATTGFIPGDDPWLIWKYRLMGDQSENTAELHVNRVAGDYVKLFNLHIVSGRDFSKDRTSARFSGEVIMNEKAIHQLNIETPEEAIGEKIISHNNDTAEIVGVVEDFHQESLEEPIDPLIFINYDYVFQNYVMSFQSSHIQKDIKQLKKLYADFFPGNPFEYFFLDQYFDTQYKAEMRFSKIFGLFTLLAIFISCIGLFGLTFLLVQHRMKEIGIRKAMGASVFSIYKTISADFIKLNTLSIALGLPVAYFTFKSWLNNYAFKIEIEEWFVITPIITIFTISILTISFKVLKAANINPADSLRDE